jgi:thiol-disulfide isomerase/thioredoxin
MSGETEILAGPTGPSQARRWPRARVVSIGFALGTIVGCGVMFGIGFRIGKRVVPRGTWWQRITGPATLIEPVPPPLDAPGCRPGERPPPLPSKGWLHSRALNWEDLAGRVAVFDAWATWCPYCYTMAPDLVAIRQRYEKDGVVMIGITSETEGAAEDFCKLFNMNGPVICEAEYFLKLWMADRYPTLVVVGRDGRIVWNDGAARLGHRTDELIRSLEEAIESALSPPSSE